MFTQPLDAPRNLLGLGDAYLSTLFLLFSQHFLWAEIGSEQIPVKVNLCIMPLAGIEPALLCA